MYVAPNSYNKAQFDQWNKQGNWNDRQNWQRNLQTTQARNLNTQRLNRGGRHFRR
jgi:hypothetical protein